ncbi:ATP-binding protein [Streptomyces sp. NPDC088910]|uniref:ATP-binding protein n=1 Tax=Streptomyces sp. NPDC088910 TaxID=3365911 RepID=UPI00380E7B6C
MRTGVLEGRPSVAVHRWRRDPRNVAKARHALLGHMGEWGMTGLADTAVLVLSELFTNAVRHARGPQDRLVETRYERLTDGALRIEVHDANSVRPEAREPSVDAESGRGLALVDVLTAGRWGVSERLGVGKLVWAVCADDTADEVPR